MKITKILTVLLMVSLPFFFIHCTGGENDVDEMSIQNNESEETPDDNNVSLSDCTDDDADCVMESEDNCPLSLQESICATEEIVNGACNLNTFNPSQSDVDLDGFGDVCDLCPSLSTNIQRDRDRDSIGDECDNDADGDGIDNGADNCPTAWNPSQTDLDNDLCGAACDIAEEVGDEPKIPVPSEACQDHDRDGVEDNQDNCPTTDSGPFDPNNQCDIDKDSFGDACDDDIDDDGIINSVDDYDYSPGDNCYGDADGDEICDAYDNCPNIANSCQTDSDNDNVGDDCDLCNGVVPATDNDSDGCEDSAQAPAPGTSIPVTLDTDNDGIPDNGDNSDTTGDNPCVENQTTGCDDNCIDEPNVNQKDNDGDGTGNVCDKDQDDDGLCDKNESAYCSPEIDPDKSTPNRWFYIDPNNPNATVGNPPAADVWYNFTYILKSGTAEPNKTPVPTNTKIRVDGVVNYGHAEQTRYTSCLDQNNGYSTQTLGICIQEQTLKEGISTPAFDPDNFNTFHFSF